MEHTKISVIVPVYNVEKYIRKCLDSILSQDYKDFEIIAVDDESPDNCGAILDEYASKYSEKIRVIHQKNKGLGGARNTGINNANGEYLLFIDSDDFIAPDMLSCLMKEIEHTGADIAVCGITYIDENGNTWESMDSGFDYHRAYNVKDNKNLITISPAAWNKLYKKDLFIKNEIRYPERVWYEDIRTTVKLIACANSVVFTDKCPYYYLQRDGSIIHSGNIERNREIILAFDDIFSYYKQNGLYDDYRTELEYLTLQSVFWDASVRVLKVTSKHSVLDELYNYTVCNFPDAFKNSYFSKFVDMNRKIRRMLFFCLKHRLYFVVYFLLKVKS